MNHNDATATTKGAVVIVVSLWFNHPFSTQQTFVLLTANDRPAMIGVIFDVISQDGLSTEGGGSCGAGR